MKFNICACLIKMNVKSNIRISALPFGNKIAYTDYCAISITRRMEATMPRRLEYCAIGKVDRFVYRTASVNINGMHITASASESRT